jgi:biopolymer transport protein ExbD
MRTLSGRGSGKRARIEIIPLIDIIFFLLATFIMVSLSMTKNQGVHVALPAAASAASLAEPTDEAVTLSVTSEGDVFYNKEKITLAQLPLRLQTLKSTVQDPKVILNSDSGADFKYVVAVLDEVRKIGIGKVGINTDKR